MSGGLRDYVFEQPLYDVHEHHMPEILGDRDVGLLKLFQQSYAGWTQVRPYRVASESEGEAAAGSPPGSWDDIAAYVERSGSNAFVRTLCSSLSELYELGDGGITQENWEALDGEIRRRRRDPGWAAAVMSKAGV